MRPGGVAAGLVGLAVLLALLAADSPPGGDAEAGGPERALRSAGVEASSDGEEPVGEEPAVDGWPIVWRRSKALGKPWDGRLRRGVKLPSEGANFLTWDPIHKTTPNRIGRRWATNRMIRTALRVARDYRARHPRAPRLLIGDLSRRRGGDFGPQYGGIGHASHQNGLDIDVYYARRDGEDVAATKPGQVQRKRAQTLVDLWVAEGAKYVFVGPSLGLSGPPGVVQELVHHDNHLHARLPKRRR